MDEGGDTSDTRAEGAPEAARPNKAFWGLTFGSLGIVFGDVGTSPLYALRESLASVGTPHDSEIIGIVSLLIWSLTLVVTLKYVLILLWADNHGEGGTLALMALARNALQGRWRGLILVFGTVGAALFYGDAILTPAISVVSAVEGLEVVAPGIAPMVVPITVGILIALFSMQSRGSGRIASVFGPVMLVWFAVLTIIGFLHILEAPQILRAFSPIEAVMFLTGHGLVGFLTLGSVFLAVTGAEALYADMGHFGRAPIRTAWLLVAFPALVINYLGQGAHAIIRPDAIGTLFFSAVPEWAQIPMVLLATMATVIASQAVISGTFSLTWQAMRLGLLPYLRVLHTSSRMPNQVYIPSVNWLMLAGVLGLLFIFKGSSGLAGAYGIAVSGTMVVTTVMAVFVFTTVLQWGTVKVLALFAPLLVIDVAFLSANLFKIDGGGYVPLTVAGVVMLLIWTWVRGSRLLAERLRGESVMLADLMISLKDEPIARVDGTAVFLTAIPEMAPLALLHNLKHNRVLHRHNIIVTVRTAPGPRVDDAKRAIVAGLGEDFSAVELSYGFMERPNVVSGLTIARAEGLDFDFEASSFFITRRSLRPVTGSVLLRWQERLFISMTELSDDSSDYFAIPSARAVEMGIQIDL
jgi:KUP system potassium uptake protein